MDGKVLNDKTKELIIGFIVSLFGRKIKWYVRAIIRPVLRLVINFADGYGDRVIPDEVDSLINISILAINDNEFDRAGQAIGQAIDKMVIIQGTNDIIQRNAIISGAMFVMDLIRGHIEKKKGS